MERLLARRTHVGAARRQRDVGGDRLLGHEGRNGRRRLLTAQMQPFLDVLRAPAPSAKDAAA